MTNQIYGAQHEPLITLKQAAGSRLAEERTTEAIDTTWQVMLAIEKELGPLTFADTILTPEELDEGFRGSFKATIYEALIPFRTSDAAMKALERAGHGRVEPLRPFLGRRLFSLFFAFQGVLGRVAVLTEQSFAQRRYRNWREDQGIQAHLGAVFPPETVAHFRASPQGLFAVQGAIKETFLDAAEKERAALR